MATKKPLPFQAEAQELYEAIHPTVAHKDCVEAIRRYLANIDACAKANEYDRGYRDGWNSVAAPER